MHGSHDPGENRTVADAGIEQPQSGRARVDIGELLRNPIGHHLLSLQVLTNNKYFWRLSKKRKLRCPSPSGACAA